MGDRRGTVRPPSSAEAGQDPSSRRGRRLAVGGSIVVVVVLASGVVVALAHAFGGSAEPRPPASTARASSLRAPLDAQGRPYRPFEPNSWWNTPIPANAPLNPQGTQILHYLSTARHGGQGCLRLAGARNNRWGQPAYWAGAGDPQYDVQGLPATAPPEMSHLRIPAGARGADNSDGTMTVYDVARGYVVLMTDARYDPATDTWSASGATVTYLNSNGLSAATGRSDNPHNIGMHRGNNGATSYVRYDMVKAGAVRNVLKIASGPTLSQRWVFPMTRSDGKFTDPTLGAPPEGLRMRLKPSLDLRALGLRPQALVIAEALQKYGVYLGDSSRTTSLKLEDTRTEGRGQLWNLAANDLCKVPFSPSFWDVLPGGYDPSSHG